MRLSGEIRMVLLKNRNKIRLIHWRTWYISLKEGYDLVLSHGNGPQVGNILMRNDAGEQMYGIAQMPLDICVADSQGGIGYMIERIFRNVLRKHGIKKNVVTIVTQVMIDKNDTAFQDPQKRVGKIYSKQEADDLTEKKGLDI